MVGCTCGKTLEFAGLHKQTCALMRLQLISPQMPIVGCTCGKAFGSAGGHRRKCALLRFKPSVEDKPLVKTELERGVALATVAVLKQFERLVRSDDLIKPENMERILGRVQNALTSSQNGLVANAAQMDIQSVVYKAVGLFTEKSIEIPRIFLARNVQVANYDDFELDLKGLHFKPQSASDRVPCPSEARLEEYLVRRLVDFEHVCYEHHRQLLYKLAGAVVRHLQSYLTNEDDIKNVLCFHAGLTDFVYGQMQAHQTRKATDYDVHVTQGFITLRPQNYVIPKDVSHRDFRFPVDEKVFSRGVPFAGFKRCLSASQHFSSDAERRFATLLEDENDPTIMKWIKPDRGVLQIYDKDNEPYEPDFLVETRTSKMICEIRSGYDSELQDRAESAAKWCEYATVQEKQSRGKTWSYLLIPKNAVQSRLSWAMWRTQLKIESPSKFEELFG
jgi:type III restriction enzyme